MGKLVNLGIFIAMIAVGNFSQATGCNSSLDCGFAQSCEQGKCAPECRSTIDCGFGQSCENGSCTGGQPECRSNLDCGFAQHCDDSGSCVGNSAN